MKPQKIAVIGGVAAGSAAAAEAKRVDPDAEVVLFEKGPYISYGACEMPMVIAGSITDSEQLIAFTPERFESERSVNVRINTVVKSFDPRSGALIFSDAEDSEGSVSEPETERFDKFILATGASALRPGVDGIEDRNVFVLRELTDVQAIQSFLDSNDVQHAVVVGGGFVGLEVADALFERGLRVTLLQAGPGPLYQHLESEISEMVRDLVIQAGVSFRNERMTGFERSAGRVTAVRTDARELIGCQMVVLAMGIRPNTSLGESAGVKTGKSGGFSVSDSMRTNLPNVWACGDCVEVRRVIDDMCLISPLSLTAFRSARVAGNNAARRGRSKQALFPGIVGAQALKIFGSEIVFVGLTVKEATEAGFKPSTVLIKHRTSADLVPGSSFIHVLLVFDRVMGRLLGGQLFGKTGAALRGDILIPVIRGGGTVSDLYDLDLIYAPPFSPRLDPLLVAAKKAMGLLENEIPAAYHRKA